MNEVTWPQAARSFLRCEALFPDESLPSYLFRLAEANGYTSFRLFETVCKERLKARGVREGLTRSAHPETYDILGELTGTSPRELAQATIHRLAHAPVLADFHFPTIVLSDEQPLRTLEHWLRPRFLRRENRTQFCPACLQEAAYHRLRWNLLEVTACCRHRCWLLTACPDCGVRVSIQAVARSRCSSCKGDLRSAAAVSLQDRSFELFMQRTLQSWWGFVAPVTSQDWALPAEPVPILHRVWARLLKILHSKLHVEYAFGLFETMPARRELQVIVFGALVDWPHGFYDFLRLYLPQKSLARTRIFRPDVSNLDAFRLSWEEGVWATYSGYAFVQDAFDTFMIEMPVPDR